MPESFAFMEALRADGVAAVISGAGPTVLAFSDGPDPAHEEAAALLARCPEGWRAHHVAVDREGARLG
jgi:homoserine kinase